MTKDLRAMTLVVIYTLGHFVIAAACNHFITGAPLDLAAADALVEPGINAVWLYLLTKLFDKGEK